jgi:hydroxymethylpyrimidine pyrophosphatase-like HAD family hydrolase
MDAGTPVRRAARIRLLVADVDGTLTNSRHEVEDATCRVVDRLRTAGVRVMLATGRRYRDTLPVQERLGIDDAPLVTASGALVKRPADHATLWRAAFAPGVLGSVLRRIVAAGHEPVVYTDDFAAGRDFHCRSLAGAEPGGGGLAEYLHRHRDLADVRPDLDVAPPAGVFAGFTMGSRDAMLALEADLAAALPGALSTHVIKSPRYRDWLCEIAPAGTTKWSGAAAVAAGWGIAAHEICAVGDDRNDLPMIRAAGLGVAMGNAADEVRAAADVVVGTHDGTGIADVAELILAGLAQPAPLGGAGSRTV